MEEKFLSVVTVYMLFSPITISSYFFCINVRSHVVCYLQQFCMMAMAAINAMLSLCAPNIFLNVIYVVWKLLPSAAFIHLVFECFFFLQTGRTRMVEMEAYHKYIVNCFYSNKRMKKKNALWVAGWVDRMWVWKMHITLVCKGDEDGGRRLVWIIIMHYIGGFLWCNVMQTQTGCWIDQTEPGNT